MFRESPTVDGDALFLCCLFVVLLLSNLFTVISFFNVEEDPLVVFDLFVLFVCLDLFEVEEEEEALDPLLPLPPLPPPAAVFKYDFELFDFVKEFPSDAAALGVFGLDD